MTRHDRALLSRQTLTPPDIGLRQMNPEDLCIQRTGGSDAFVYHLPCGSLLSADHQAAINALAIPPAWQDVKISPRQDTHLLAIGEDAAGRRQYLYHPDWRTACEEAKFADLPLFAERLPRLRQHVRKILSRDEPSERYAIATIIRLLDRAGLRIGNWRGENDGAVTLNNSHIEQSDDTLALSYTGKGGKQREVEIDDPYLSEAIETLQQLPGSALFKWPGKTIRPKEVNQYIAEIMGFTFTAKDFRTWGGSVAAAQALVKDGAATIGEISDAAACWLGNTPSIARASYIHPAIIEVVGNEYDGTPSGPHRLRKYERICFALIENWVPGLPRRQ